VVQLDKEAARQQDLLYNAEIQIQQIERKIARGMGERSDGKRIALKKQIEKLKIALVAAKRQTKNASGSVPKACERACYS
jgi:coiled-coil domain-containing protein 39